MAFAVLLMPGRHDLAELYSRSFMHGKALGVLESGAGMSSSSDRRKLSEILYRFGDYDRALMELEIVVSETSADIDTLRTLATIYIAVMRPLDAMETLERILLMDSSDAGAMESLNYLYRRFQMVDREIANLEKMVQVIRDKPHYRHDLINHHLAAGNLERAISEAGKLSDDYPDDLDARRLYRSILHFAGKRDDLQKWLSELQKKGRKDPESLILLGSFLQSESKFREAADTYLDAVNLGGGFSASLGLGSALIDCGDKQALKVLGDLVNGRPDQADAVCELARAHIMVGDGIGSAIDLMETWAEGRIERAEFVERFSYVLVRSGLKGSSPTLRDYISKDVSPQVRSALVTAMISDGTASVDVEAAEFLVNEYPQEPSNWVMLIDALQSGDNLEKLADVIDRALKLHSGDPEIGIRAATFYQMMGNFRESVKLSGDLLASGKGDQNVLRALFLDNCTKLPPDEALRLMAFLEGMSGTDASATRPPDLALAMADRLNASGRVNEALQELSKVAENPDTIESADLAYRLAEVYMDCGQNGVSTDFFRRFTELLTNDMITDSWDARRRARALSLTDRRPEAVALLKRSMGLYTNDPELPVDLAEILTDLGKYDDALELIREFVLNTEINVGLK